MMVKKVKKIDDKREITRNDDNEKNLLKEGEIMTRASRAKQFCHLMLCQDLKKHWKKRNKKEAKIELAEDSLQELESKLNELEKGSIIKLIYYKNNRYIETIGTVAKIDYMRKKIILIHGDEIVNALSRKNYVENEDGNVNEVVNVCDVIEIEKIN